MPVLRKVRVLGISEFPVFQYGFLENAASHGYDGFISIIMLTSTSCYPTVHDLWACYGAFQRK